MRPFRGPRTDVPAEPPLIDPVHIKYQQLLFSNNLITER